MAYTQITDHDAQALARLAFQFESSTNLRAVISAGAASVQTAEDVLWALYNERLLDGAEGAQLDAIGAVIGQAREAATDDQYRARLRGRILANRSDNSVETLLSIVRAVLGVAVVATLTQYQPAAFVIDVSGEVSDDDAEVLAGLIADARAAGIGAGLIYATEPDDEAFTFAGPVGFLSAATLAGVSALTITGDATEFPASGALLVGEGTANVENVSYVSRVGSVFTLAGPTANAHAQYDAIVVAPTTQQGFGDSTNPATGGVFAGVLAA